MTPSLILFFSKLDRFNGPRVSFYKVRVFWFPEVFQLAPRDSEFLSLSLAIKQKYRLTRVTI